MRQHGRHDVGVVNLPASDANLTTQRDQRLGDKGAVFENLETADQSVGVIKRVLAVRWRPPKSVDG